MNIINGGKHADNKLAFQEFMIAPIGKDFVESLRIGAEVYHQLKKEIANQYGKDSTNVGDEGGFAPNLQSVEEPLRLIMKSVNALRYKSKVRICMDAAASEFYDAKRKAYLVEGKWLSSAQLASLYQRLVRKYPIVSVEDPFHEEDFEAFAAITRKLPCQVVGDDLLVTNPERIEQAIEKRACNALLLKVNQIGTLSEAIEAALLARLNGWHVMVSHRSGETGDAFIADLSVALNTGQLKTGAPARYERLAKYNQLLRIEEELGRKARFPKSFGA